MKKRKQKRIIQRLEAIVDELAVVADGYAPGQDIDRAADPYDVGLIAFAEPCEDEFFLVRRAAASGSTEAEARRNFRLKARQLHQAVGRNDPCPDRLCEEEGHECKLRTAIHIESCGPERFTFLAGDTIEKEVCVGLIAHGCFCREAS